MALYDLGFLGGGQLARMSIQAAQRMGLRCYSLDQGHVTPASQIADSLNGALNDPTKIAEVLKQCEFVTLENEFIPGSAIREALNIAGRGEDAIIPGVGTLETIQDKLHQRQALLTAGVASPKAVPLDDDGSLAREKIGFPMVLKARFGGYDGKGTRYARTPEEMESHRDLWGKGGWLAEQFVPFKRELAVMVLRYGSTEAAFPTMETVQTHHVCDLVFPCEADGRDVAIRAIRAVHGTGLFGVELFELEDGQILVNELAPRPHNTGHYTLDWGGPSQFEAHVRAVMGLPLAQPESSSFAVMANLLGQEGAGDYLQGLSAALGYAGAHFHWYGKVESRPGRKMGHLNVQGRAGETVADVVERAKRARADFYSAWTATR